MEFYKIDEKRARYARSMWSFSDYIDGSTTQSYQSQVNYCYELGKEVKQRNSEDRHEYIDYLCDKYAKKLAEYYNKDISIQLMCPSVMISGASNFPVRKKEKQNNARDKNMRFYTDIQQILTKISDIGTGREIIKSSDPLAIEKLLDKLETLQEKQDEMKEQNAYFRKHKTLTGYKNLTDSEVIILDEKIKKTYWGKPYADFELINNNAKIKNTKERIDKLQKVKDEGNQKYNTSICQVVEDSTDMRIRLIFDEKPIEEIRSLLKSNGFKWSPKNTAWQRQLTNNAKNATKKVLKEIEKIK